MEKRRLFGKGDLILIIGIAAIAAIMFFFLRFNSDDSLKGEIIVDGKIYQTVELKDGQSERFVIDSTESGIKCEILAENGEIKFISSQCHDKICIAAGALSHKGDTAACLPAGVLVRIISGEASPVDVIAY